LVFVLLLGYDGLYGRSNLNKPKDIRLFSADWPEVKFIDGPPITSWSSSLRIKFNLPGRW